MGMSVSRGNLQFLLHRDSVGLCLDIDGQLKAAQGHHATVEVGKSVRNYRTADVLPQLKCPQELLNALGTG